MPVFPLGKGLKPVYIYLSENHEAAILHALFIHLFGVMLSTCETSVVTKTWNYLQPPKTT